MKQARGHRSRSQSGSALLLMLLLTLAGGALFGLAIDATALLWARSNAQTAANAAAGAVEVELARNPKAEPAFLEAAARAAAALNGYKHGIQSAEVRLQRDESGIAVILRRQADVYVLRAVRPQPIAIRARGTVRF